MIRDDSGVRGEAAGLLVPLSICLEEKEREEQKNRTGARSRPSGKLWVKTGTLKT